MSLYLPEWLKSGRQRQQAQAQDYGISDSFENAPGWRIVGDDFMTCVPPADRPINPGVLRAIHSFDPGLIPIWRKQLYLPPGAQRPILVTHHGLARHVKDPKGARRLFHVEMPRNAKHPVPNLLEAILEQEDECMLHEGGPGSFQRFDMWLYRILRKQFNVTKSPAQIIEAIFKKRDEARERATKRFREEHAYRQKHLDRYVAARIDKISPSDERAYFNAARNHKARPMVFVKGAV